MMLLPMGFIHYFPFIPIFFAFFCGFFEFYIENYAAKLWLHFFFLFKYITLEIVFNVWEKMVFCRSSLFLLFHSVFLLLLLEMKSSRTYRKFRLVLLLRVCFGLFFFLRLFNACCRSL